MRILIAHDEAFNFTYRANVDALRAIGDVDFFSPLHDSTLPPCDLMYLPGGYPELFAETIGDNEGMHRQIREYAEQGGQILAECGGFMYLCHDIDGTPMCGIFPYSATMRDARLHLGYRNWNGMKGHEFHYSTLCEPHDMVCRYKNVVAGYTHWYWAETGFMAFWHDMLRHT